MIKYEGYDTFCAHTSIIHGVGCRHSCPLFYTGGDGTIPCFHLYGIQLSCSPNGIQNMKPVLPEGRSMHKISNGYRIKLFEYCNPQNCWCPDHLKNCCIFLATLNRDQEQSPPNQLLWWQLPLFFRTTQAGGSREEPKGTTTLPVPEKKASLRQQGALFFLCLPWLGVKWDLPAGWASLSERMEQRTPLQKEAQGAAAALQEP